jgi:hypothetical protein
VLYGIVRQEGLDFVLIYRNARTNRAGFSAIGACWAERRTGSWRSRWKGTTGDGVGLPPLIGKPRIGAERREASTSSNTALVSGNLDDLAGYSMTTAALQQLRNPVRGRDVDDQLWT